MPLSLAITNEEKILVTLNPTTAAAIRPALDAVRKDARAAWDAAWDAARDAANASSEIQGAHLLRERGKPFFFLPAFGFASPDDIPARPANYGEVA